MPDPPGRSCEAPAMMGLEQSPSREPDDGTKSRRPASQQHDSLQNCLTISDSAPKVMSTFQPGHSPLELLPNELLFKTVKALGPIQFALEDTKDHQEHTASLRNLCLVSKRIADFARPALYTDLRAYSNDRSISLCATLLKTPQLTSHVKSILFFPPRPRAVGDIYVDLRALCHLDDPDFAYWTRNGNPASVHMPEHTMGKMVYNLLFKVLTRTLALEALYIRPLKLLKPPGSRHPSQKKKDAECLEQLDRQHRLFEGFHQGSLLPKLQRLKTVGVLRGSTELEECLGVPSFFQKIIYSSNLAEVCWARLEPPSARSLRSYRSLRFQRAALQEYRGHRLYHNREVDISSTNVTRVHIRSLELGIGNIERLTTAFPSLASLTIEGDCDFGDFDPNGTPPGDLRAIFLWLGNLENLQTLEFDHGAARFRTDISTAAGPAKLVDLSQMSKLRTLVVPVDFFINFTSGENPVIQRITTLLPSSLRCLTLLLNVSCDKRMEEERGFRVDDTARMDRNFLPELASDLLVEYPGLDKVDLCYHMKLYRRNKVYSLAARSTSHTG